MIDYLQRYNGECPHRGLNYMAPYQVIARQLPHLSGMYWTRTNICVPSYERIQFTAIMAGILPLSVRPYLLARRQTRLVGELPMSRIPRFLEICNPVRDMVRADVEFSEYEAGVVRAGIILQVELVLQCCRCLEDLRQELNVRSYLFIARSEESARNIDNDKDLILCENEELDLAVLVEDELLLQLPQFPMHQNRAYCDSTMLKEIQYSREKMQTQNPFSILKRLSN